jgi:hypothetical protein
MKNCFKICRENRRSALGSVLVISVLLLQQTFASAPYFCGSSTSSSGKRACHSRQHADSSPSRKGSQVAGKVKSSHCKASSERASQKAGADVFKRAGSITGGVQLGGPFSTSSACCKIEKSEAPIPDSIIPTSDASVVEVPTVEYDRSNCSPPVARAAISHPPSRPVYLLLSSFLI